MGSATVRWQAMTEEQSPSRVASPEIDARKKLLRARISELRGQVGRKRAWEAGRAMAHLLARNPLFEAADSTALFSALGDEPDTRPLFDLLRREGRRVFFPRCRQDGGLDLFRVDAWRDLVPGHFGILEPPRTATPSDPLDLDLMLVPGVAFDARGARLGRGGGFYDRILPLRGAPGAPFLLGLAFAFQLVERVPSDERDRRVDAILTEEGLIPAKGER